MERESGCGRCGKRKWVWLGDVWRGEVGVLEKRMEVCGGEVGVGEECEVGGEGKWVW